MATRLESSRTIYQDILRLYAKSNAAPDNTTKPRLFMHSYSYRSIIHKRQFVTDIRHRQLRRTTVPDYSGLRMATPDYSGLLRRPQGFSAPSPMTSLALGKLPTRLPVSPMPVLSTSTFARLGRDSLIYNGGGSSLCWSVAGALRPHNPY